jgi:hypothetical protein
MLILNEHKTMPSGLKNLFYYLKKSIIECSLVGLNLTGCEEGYKEVGGEAYS